MGDVKEEDVLAFMAKVTTPPRQNPPRIASALQGVSRIDVETPAGVIAAWRLGEGPATLLSHGWSGDNSTWDALIQRLAAGGKAVVVVDHLGHGFSADAQCTRSKAAAGLLAAAAKLGPVDTAAGHSFGGPSLGMALAKGLGAKRAVFIAPAPARSMRWLRTAEEMGLDRAVAERALQIEEERGDMFDMAAAGAHHKTPVIFFHSKDDPAVPYKSSETAAAAWPGAEFVLVDGLGHSAIMNDRAVVERAANFLAG